MKYKRILIDKFEENLRSLKFNCNSIKKFVVTNCSKERPGSIVNETLKNGILMLKDTSKELDFHVDSKYISFIKFSFVIKSYEPEKICLILENRRKYPLKVIES